MPEANVLYSVTAAVVLGLVTWVAVVLKTAKEPWARDLPKPARAPAGDDVPLETPAENEMTSEGAPVSAKAEPEKAEPEKAEAEEKADADAKAEEKQAEADEKADEKKADEKKADEKA